MGTNKVSNAFLIRFAKRAIHQDVISMFCCFEAFLEMTTKAPKTKFSERVKLPGSRIEIFAVLGLLYELNDTVTLVRLLHFTGLWKTGIKTRRLFSASCRKLHCFSKNRKIEMSLQIEALMKPWPQSSIKGSE